MGKKESKATRRRLVNAYLSSVISISLVLLLIGVASLLLVNAGSVSRYFKESVQVSLILADNVSEEVGADYAEELASRSQIRSARFVSREQGEEELKQMLGEGFLSVFESSPVPLSIELSLEASYVCPDSLAVLLPSLESEELVAEADCQSGLVDALNANLAKISAVLGVFIALMLFISFVLINNTVRINVFARRFTIRTMSLVGASRSFIRRPFMLSALLQGLVSALIALGGLALIFFFLGNSFPELSTPTGARSRLIVALIVLVSGLIICTVSTFFVVNKLLKVSKDKLYY